jgi:hypothetical protein
MIDESLKARIESIMQNITLKCQEEDEATSALIDNDLGFSYIRSLYFEYSIFDGVRLYSKLPRSYDVQLRSFRSLGRTASRESFRTRLSKQQAQ